jgi:hypothetical protein
MGAWTKKKGTSKGSDCYWTPPYATDLIVPYLPLGQTILEGAWGSGMLATHLQSKGYRVVGNHDFDFLTDTLEFDLIVSNPPYSLKDEFLKRAYEHGKPFAFLLPADSLVGKQRYELFAKHGCQLLIPNRRIEYVGPDPWKSQANFNSFWVCWKLLPQDIIFCQV